MHATSIKAPKAEIQATLLAVKNCPSPVELKISGIEGPPFVDSRGAFAGYGAAARGGAAIGGDGITVVLNGFPSLLLNRYFGYQ